MYDETKELTLRVHDECAFLPTLLLLRSEYLQATDRMSLVPTFALASPISCLQSKSASERRKEGVLVSAFTSVKRGELSEKSLSMLFTLCQIRYG